MPEIEPETKRKLQIGGLVGVILLAAVLAVFLLIALVKSMQPARGIMPTFEATAYPSAQPTPVAQATVVPTQDPNDFSGDWYFTGFVGKMPSGLLKGNKVGRFVSVGDPNDVAYAVCSAPLSPAPKKPDPATGFPGDKLYWDPNTNHFVDYVPTVPEGTVQVFWYPTRTNPAH